MTNRPVDEKNTTRSRNKHPCSRRGSNPQSQQANGPCLRPCSHWYRRSSTPCFNWSNFTPYINCYFCRLSRDLWNRDFVNSGLKGLIFVHAE